MEERLTRYQLGIIEKIHDEAHYNGVTQEYLAQQLERIGLPPRVSRFNLAQRIKELERQLS